MKPNIAILLLLLPLTTGLKAKDDGHDNKSHSTSEQSQALTASAILSGQLQEIASSSTLSPKSKAKLIANAVRTAITTATAEIKDPEQRLALALELTTAAAKAAPQFAASITSAVSGIPSIAHIKGALDEIQDAVKKGKEQGDDTDTANPSHNDGHHHGHHDFDGPGDHDHPVSPSK